MVSYYHHPTVAPPPPASAPVPAPPPSVAPQPQIPPPPQPSMDSSMVNQGPPQAVPPPLAPSATGPTTVPLLSPSTYPAPYYVPHHYCMANALLLPTYCIHNGYQPQTFQPESTEMPKYEVATLVADETEEIPTGTVYYSQTQPRIHYLYPPSLQAVQPFTSNTDQNSYVAPSPNGFLPPVNPGLTRLPPQPPSIFTSKIPIVSMFSPPHAYVPTPIYSAPYRILQHGELRKSPIRDNNFVPGMKQAAYKFSGNNDFRMFSERENFNRNDSILRNRPGPSMANYRTKLCINFKNGHCPYGEKCRFIHQSSNSSTKFSANAPTFVPAANANRAEESPPTSVEMDAPNRMYSSTPVSLLTKDQDRGLQSEETTGTPVSRRISYRHDLSAGYRRPSVADGPHPLPNC